MHPNKRIKKEARLRLAERWPGALAVTVTVLVAYFLILMLNEFLLQLHFGFSPEALLPLSDLFGPLGFLLLYVDLMVVFFLLLPLRLGMLRYFFSHATLESTDPALCSAASVFWFFTDWNRYLSALLHGLRMGCRLLLRALISFAPGLFCHIIAQIFCRADFLAFENHTPGDPVPTGILLTASGNLLLAVGLLFFLVQISRYFLVDYLFLEDESRSTRWCIARSSVILHLHRNKILSLGSSFLGWALTCALGFPLLYVVPLTHMSFAVAAKWLLRLAEPIPPAPETILPPQE